MSAMFLNAGEVTVSFAFPLAGALVSASWANPTSGSLGGVCAESVAAAIIDRARERSNIGSLIVGGCGETRPPPGVPHVLGTPTDCERRRWQRMPFPVVARSLRGRRRSLRHRRAFHDGGEGAAVRGW